MRTELKARDHVVCLDPFGFENTFAILMRRDQAERLGIRTISDLLAHQRDIRPGFGPEFMNRPDGYPGLVRAYGLSSPMPRGRWTGTCSIKRSHKARSTWPRETRPTAESPLDLVLLEDDRRFFPPYQAVPLVREETLRRHPARAVLNRLAGKIDAGMMGRLNHEVDQEGKKPEEVAHGFLRRKGLLLKD